MDPVVNPDWDTQMANAKVSVQSQVKSTLTLETWIDPLCDAHHSASHFIILTPCV